MKPILILIFLVITNSIFSQIKGEEVRISCESAKEIDLKFFMDTYIEAEYWGDIRKMSKEFDPMFFNHKTTKFKKIVLTIYNTPRGELILNTNTEYHPKENEILFLFENDNNVRELSSQKIFFKIGHDIKQSIAKNALDFTLLMHFLKCSVFNNENFPEDLVINAYNNEINTKD